jgi:hypothetical protein
MVDREALRRQQSELQALRHSIAFKKGWLIGFAVWFALLFLIGVASTNGDLEGAIVIALVFSLPYVMLWLLVVMGVAIAFETRNPPPIIVRTLRACMPSSATLLGWSAGATGRRAWSNPDAAY